MLRKHKFRCKKCGALCKPGTNYCKEHFSKITLTKKMKLVWK